MLQCLSADKNPIRLEDFGHQCQSLVNGWAQIISQYHVVIRVGKFAIAEHHPVISAKLSNVADVSSIACTNVLGHLAHGHIDAIART
jgi:hypothetical protein